MSSQSDRFRAASVHVLTAVGAACALFALIAAVDRRFEISFAWLGVAFVIDGIDGFFARRFSVATVLPNVSGETIDLCVDYLTYVFVPAVLLLLAGKLSGPFGLGVAGLVCVSSLYHFADTGSKSADHCFVGFPAIWNLVAFYVFAFDVGEVATSAIALVCVGLTFVPWKWVHPMRVVAMRRPTLAMVALWALAACDVLVDGFPARRLTGAILLIVLVYWLGLVLRFGRAR